MAAVIPWLWVLGCSGSPAPDTGAPNGLAGAAVAPEDRVVVVGDVVELDASDSVGTELLWDFDDGTQASGAVVTHTWTAPGRYHVQLTAEGAPPDADSLTITAVNPPLSPPPVASGKLVSDGHRLFAALTDFDQVAVVDNGDVTWLDVCDAPTALSWGDDQLAVACRDGFQHYDASLKRIEDSPIPAAAVLLHDGLWVLGTDGSLYDPDGQVIQALRGRTLVGWAQHIATAAFLSPQTEATWWNDGETLGIARDPGPDSDTNARGVPNLLGSGAVRPDGDVVVWGGLKSNTERGVFLEGTEFSHDNTVRSSLEVLDVQSGLEREGPLFDNRDRIGAVAWTPMGDRLLVAHHGAAIVDLLDGETFQRVGGWQNVGQGLDGLWTDGTTAWVLASLDRELVAFDLTAGNAQVELARISIIEQEILDADVLWGAQLFHSASNPQMSTDAYISCGSCHPDGGHDGQTWDFTGRGEGLRNTQSLWSMPADGPFHWSANFDELQDFENDIRLHQNGTGFLSDEDWKAESDPLGAPRTGWSEELDALAAYMRHLAEQAAPLPPAPDADDTAFWTAGCGDCHSGTDGTDAGWDGDQPIVHDVGTLTAASGQRRWETLTGLRTPGLRGVAWTGPWLHDGSASSLEAAIVAHSMYAELSADELAAIVDALNSL